MLTQCNPALEQASNALEVMVAIRVFLSQKNVQKWGLISQWEKKYMCRNKVIFEKVMTQIFYPKNCNKFLDNKICRYYVWILCPIRIVLRNTSIAIVAKDELTFFEILKQCKLYAWTWSAFYFVQIAGINRQPCKR